MYKFVTAFWGAWLVFIFASVAAYITNLVWIVSTLTSEIALPLNKVVLAVICLFPPIGVIHGYIIWFGGGL